MIPISFWHFLQWSIETENVIRRIASIAHKHYFLIFARITLLTFLNKGYEWILKTQKSRTKEEKVTKSSNG